MADLEGRGLTGVMIASETFRQATAVQAAALGTDPAAVFVPHPIQDRTDEEMVALATAAMPHLLSQLVEEKDT